MTIGQKEVGSLVWLRVDGEFRAFRVMHHGKPSDLYDSSWTGGTVIMLDYTETPLTINMVSSTVSGMPDEKGTYQTSNAHRQLNSNWLARMDEGVAAVIREVKLPYRNDTNGDRTVASGSAGLPAKIWLPSVIEVARGSAYLEGKPTFYVREGAVFDYWVEASTERYLLWGCENDDGDDMGWGTRTPNSQSGGDEAAYFNVVRRNGMCYNGNENSVQVRPCLVLPDEVAVDGDNYIRAGRTIHCKAGGVWREGTCSVKAGGVWKELAQLAVKVGGAWKE